MSKAHYVVMCETAGMMDSYEYFISKEEAIRRFNYRTGRPCADWIGTTLYQGDITPLGDLIGFSWTGKLFTLSKAYQEVEQDLEVY